MKSTTARAIQIAALERDQLDTLHTIEKRCGHILPNWNIQEIFHLPNLKDKWKIPDDEISQKNHNDRIEMEIASKRLFFTPEEPQDKVDFWHSFDWNVTSRRNEIVWECGTVGRRKFQRLADIASEG